jgi:hypothetical protein
MLSDHVVHVIHVIDDDGAAQDTLAFLPTADGFSVRGPGRWPSQQDDWV